MYRLTCLNERVSAPAHQHMAVHGIPKTRLSRGLSVQTDRGEQIDPQIDACTGVHGRESIPAFSRDKPVQCVAELSCA